VSTNDLGGHVHTIEQGPGRRRRRAHSAAFKAEAVAACRQPGMSIAAAALAHAINANLLRRWVVAAERGEAVTVSAPKALPSPRDAFIAVPVQAKRGGDTPIRIKVRRGALTVSVHWPSSGMHECAIWLREVLK